MSTLKRAVDRMLDLQLALENSVSACRSASRREDSLRKRLDEAEAELGVLRVNLQNLHHSYTQLLDKESYT